MAIDPKTKSGEPSGGDFDFTRFFSEMKLPPMPDLEVLTTATRRNMEAFAAASRVAFEGAQALGRRNLEIMQQASAEMAEAMKSLAGVEAPQDRAARQAELLKQAYERAVANLKELGDLIQRSNTDALALINKRFTEAMDELRAMAQKAK